MFEDIRKREDKKYLCYRCLRAGADRSMALDGKRGQQLSCFFLVGESADLLSYPSIIGLFQRIDFGHLDMLWNLCTGIYEA